MKKQHTTSLLLKYYVIIYNTPHVCFKFKTFEKKGVKTYPTPNEFLHVEEIKLTQTHYDPLLDLCDPPMLPPIVATRKQLFIYLPSGMHCNIFQFRSPIISKSGRFNCTHLKSCSTLPTAHFPNLSPQLTEVYVSVTIIKMITVMLTNQKKTD